MPFAFTPTAALLWLFAGFFVGIGWASGNWIVSKILR